MRGDYLKLSTLKRKSSVWKISKGCMRTMLVMILESRNLLRKSLKWFAWVTPIHYCTPFRLMSFKTQSLVLHVSPSLPSILNRMVTAMTCWLKIWSKIFYCLSWFLIPTVRLHSINLRVSIILKLMPQAAVLRFSATRSELNTQSTTWSYMTKLVIQIILSAWKRLSVRNWSC